MLECILTEIKPRKDQPFLNLRDIETGENFHIYIQEDSWNHTFIAQCSSKQKKLKLISILRQYLPQYEVEENNTVEHFNLLHLKAPINTRHILKDLSQLLPEHATAEHKADVKKLSKQFITGYYTNQLRTKFAHRGTKIEMPENFYAIYDLKKEFDNALTEIRKQIATQLSEYKEAYHTRVFNELNKIFLEKDKTIDEKIKEAKNNSFTNKLDKELIQKRAKIVETQKFIDKVYKTRYNEQDYCLDLILPSIDILKPKDPLTYEELIKQKWMFIDIEIPLFQEKNPEISWVV
jgi:hypothetical protein